MAVADHKRVLSGWSKADIRKLEKRKEKAEMRQVLLMFVGLRIVRLQTASLQFDESQREDKEKRKSAKEDKYRQREQEREEAEAARVRSELCCTGGFDLIWSCFSSCRTDAAFCCIRP